MVDHELLKLPKRARFSHVLRNKNFLFLWLDQLMSQLADRFLLYVLLILAYQATQSNLGVSIPMLAFGFSAVIFGPSAGVFVDRWNKKLVMIVSNLLRGLLILLIIPFISQSLAIVFLISFLIFSVSQFFAPAETSSIPILVEKRDLIAANSLFMMSLMAASIIGIGMAAPLTNFLGIKMVLIIAAALHLLSTLATFMVSLKHSKKEARVSLISLLKELLAGFEFIRRKPSIQGSLIKMFFSTAVLAVVCMLAVSFSEKILKIGAANFGYLVFSAGAGMVVGGLFLGRFSHHFKKNNLVHGGFLLSGISLLVLSYVQNVWMVLGAIFFLGMGNAFIVSPLQTILHEKVPRVIRGRVFGVQNMFINSAFTFPVVIMGEAADLIGLHVIIILLGILVLGGVILDMVVSRLLNPGKP
ncbi:MAG: MFS transporter [Candidatus Margulisbacteria bacterium]|nr:MFS transporter [Candidatus Margulisiibacteriota bacterium]MBU1021846.1 MFS transporter [Candidatus Margulisiibacteriota bacterium]MBU1729005.1 MFS transporter [Candidatus Margulisiibacteriota bacterium]MBU1954442.1 MFS transporter [Candidatus Margulisiibacteriota bacterium]